MAVAVKTLGFITAIPAERLAFGAPDWTLIDTATATALNAVLAAVQGVQHVLEHVTLSYSAATAVATLQVKDGSTVIWQAEIPAAAGPFIFDFSKCPLRATTGASLSVIVGSAGGAVVQTISAIGYSSQQLTAFT